MYESPLLLPVVGCSHPSMIRVLFKTSKLDTNHTNVFIAQCPKVIEVKMKINNQDLIKHASFCIAKETINEMKRHPRD